MPPADDLNDRERLKAIEMAVGQIEKQFGKGSIMRHCSDREGHGASAMELERVHSRFVPGRKSSENL